MREWLEGIAGPAYATAMIWTVGALLLLLVVLLLIKIVRSLTFGTFVSGGRNRKARLAVMDAAAVDSHRRLVLVRRDDVEHLILIGGPTDVVVEQNIRLAATLRRPGEEPARENGAEERQRMAAASPHPAASAHPAAGPRPAEHTAPPHQPSEPAAPRIAPIARPAAPAPAPSLSPTPPPSPAPAPRPAPQPASMLPVRQPAPPLARPAAASAAAPAVSPPSPAARPAPAHAAANAPADTPPDLDEALREELEVTLDGNRLHKEDELPDSVEDEMSKLLGELSRTKR